MSDRETQPGSIIPGVDWESGVKRLMGNEQLYRKLLAKFAASYGDAAGRIRDALSAGDRQTAHNELHTLKGVTANLSLAPLADLVLAAEQAVKHDGEFTQWLDESAALNHCYIETRYPTDVP